ncbi:hypothetical protein C6B32_01910 [Campylobacter fetus subsp. testudinum]|uniref:hypothetical protein n=1 Tax=Campylobacter fetus TaxID=196 RepID=UPI000CFC44BB|nr:hypothetical protein [Campylobacter fetus]AVK80639.1 hypothetical protein C6B32_01910 [Campylobacter fetus subsp. testudinum]
MTKQEFDETIKNIGLSRQEFCDITGLAYSSVSNWHDEKKPIPSWVSSWLANYIKSAKFDKAKKIFDDEFTE